MPDRFGNNSQDGYTAKPYEYKPSWQKDIDFNPDHRPSDRAMWIEDQGDAVIWVLEVAGLGALVLRAPQSTSFHSRTAHEDCGVSIFTTGHIGSNRI